MVNNADNTKNTNNSKRRFEQLEFWGLRELQALRVPLDVAVKVAHMTKQRNADNADNSSNTANSK